MKDLKEEVKKILKSKMWMVISTVDEKNQPHSSVVVYQSDGEIIIFQTGIDTVKAKSIKKNNNVSITIPFRKNFLHKLVPAPPAELHFTATAEILPY
ncbi:MAG: pyridoxamine 5'-phosphate oxidase family protein, partial [Candidatus Lokiarchaeota archaeon]|nr:pyridoxamine 5'-phosphate oxidase family protein [Candidatus Lokiarchaeota archaeon]